MKWEYIHQPEENKKNKCDLLDHDNLCIANLQTPHKIKNDNFTN